MFTYENCWLLGLRLYWSMSILSFRVEFSIFSRRLANSCYLFASLLKSEVNKEALKPYTDESYDYSSSD